MTKQINPVIKNDIQRYKKNKLGANLALLGIVFCCMYFIVLYAQVKNDNYYYNWSIAFDVIYNLAFLLVAFLCSEQVKNYNRKLFWLQLLMGALQVARIFWLPLGGLTAKAISYGSFIAMLIGLAGSGAFIIASAVIGFIRSRMVDEFKKKLESGEVSVEETLKELDREDGLKAVKAEALPAANEQEDK